MSKDPKKSDTGRSGTATAGRPGAVVRAAGAVLWRPLVDRPDGSDNPVEVAVVHRPRYDDWSLPKGKVDPGEIEPVTAVREIAEETGFRAHLGRRLTSISYPIEHGTKKVRYWAARVDPSAAGEFNPNDEVDKLDWLPLQDALNRLDYAQDRKVLRRFAKQPADTRTVLVVRHATAGRKSRYKGDDHKRPLDKHGRAQAESLVSVLLAFGATDLHAADRVRCLQTLEPLADELGVTIAHETTLTEEAYAVSRKPARQRLL
ncbi:MAG: ADP-ribose pyrophosphatase, partial [Mycobacterium sp.]|nr:ADP-ribose pyrophosphatase [Mycobacterium sp.]